MRNFVIASGLLLTSGFALAGAGMGWSPLPIAVPVWSETSLFVAAGIIALAALRVLRKRR